MLFLVAETWQHHGARHVQGAANVEWSFVSVLRVESRIFVAVLPRCRSWTLGSEPQGLVNLGWSLAASNTVRLRVLVAVATSNRSMVDQFSMQNLSNMVWICACSELLDRLVVQTV